MDYKAYISSKKELYNSLINFIENDGKNDNKNFFQEIINIIQKQKILETPEESKILLQLISTISVNHRRVPNFIDQLIQILQYVTENIKPSIPSTELFNIFQHDKLLLYYLFKTNIIQVNDIIVNTIVQEMDNLPTRYLHFFYPHIKDHLESKLKEDIEKRLFESCAYNFSEFESKCQQGENDSFLCELIRNDNIDEFVTYATKNNLSLSSQISSSLFETNRFLLDKNPTLIEYAAFFGSIQIFNFLRMNYVEVSGSLWFYAIHGNCADVIHLLEQISVRPKSYKKCFEEAVKCHHNGIAGYILDNLLNEEDIGFEKDCLSFYFSYFNFHFFPDEYDNEFIIYCACKYDYTALFKMLLKDKRNYMNCKKTNKKSFVRISK